MRGLPSLLYAEHMAEARRLRAEAVAALFRRLPVFRRGSGPGRAANADSRPGGGPRVDGRGAMA